jgi:hypothetical protein
MSTLEEISKLAGYDAEGAVVVPSRAAIKT